MRAGTMAKIGNLLMHIVHWPLVILFTVALVLTLVVLHILGAIIAGRTYVENLVKKMISSDEKEINSTNSAQ